MYSRQGRPKLDDRTPADPPLETRLDHVRHTLHRGTSEPSIGERGKRDPEEEREERRARMTPEQWEAEIRAKEVERRRRREERLRKGHIPAEGKRAGLGRADLRDGNR